MKRTIRLFAIATTLAVFAAPVLAQTGAKECNDENKAAWYDTFLKNRKSEAAPQQKAAYDAAKSYLTACPDDPADQIVQYLKKWVSEYERVTEGTNNKIKLQDLYNKKNYADAVGVAKQVVQGEPDYVNGYILLALSAYNASVAGNSNLLADGEQAAKKANELLDAGKPFAPTFTSKDSAIAWMNYVIAKAKLKSAPEEAIPYFLKAARLDKDLGKTGGLYQDLATAYLEGPRAKLTEQYLKLYKDKPATPESELAAANINQIIDRQIDALARAVALTATAPEKKALMDALIELYKDRNKSDSGVNELVASVLSKPLPDAPTTLTSLPTPAPTPVATGSQTGTSTGATAGTQPTKPATTTTTQPQPASKTTSTVKPAPSPTPKPPAKPRARANHRRRG